MQNINIHVSKKKIVIKADKNFHTSKNSKLLVHVQVNAEVN